MHYKKIFLACVIGLIITVFLTLLSPIAVIFTFFTGLIGLFEKIPVLGILYMLLMIGIILGSGIGINLYLTNKLPRKERILAIAIHVGVLIAFIVTGSALKLALLSFPKNFW